MIHYEFKDTHGDTLDVDYEGEGADLSLTSTYPSSDQAVTIFLTESQVRKLQIVLGDVLKQISKDK